MTKTKLFPRILYAMQMGWRYRGRLKKYLTDPHLQIKSVTDLTLAHLQQLEVQILVLDFDGVLGHDHALEPAEAVKPWLMEMYQYYQDKLFVLSNKPLNFREIYLKEHYPKLQFIKGIAKKPYPEGLLLVKNKANVLGEHILFCDDRLLTGILAAELAGIKALWVTRPIRNFVTRFWHEVFFALLRCSERVFLRVFGSI
jgi:uncharacterized protein